LETPIEELTTGSTFAGKYQIIEELGKGGIGWVYRVLDKELKEVGITQRSGKLRCVPMSD
jgi:serine/threonine protein kinase